MAKEKTGNAVCAQNMNMHQIVPALQGELLEMPTVVR